MNYQMSIEKLKITMRLFNVYKVMENSKLY
jgi:hypothetical protein